MVSDEEAAAVADEYDREAQKFMAAFDAFVTENFGTRCEDYEAGCPCCDLWAMRDQVRKLVIM